MQLYIVFLYCWQLICGDKPPFSWSHTAKTMLLRYTSAGIWWFIFKASQSIYFLKSPYLTVNITFLLNDTWLQLLYRIEQDCLFPSLPNKFAFWVLCRYFLGFWEIMKCFLICSVCRSSYIHHCLDLGETKIWSKDDMRSWLVLIRIYTAFEWGSCVNNSIIIKVLNKLASSIVSEFLHQQFMHQELR